LAKKFKTFEGFWILKSFWHTLTHSMPKDYDPFKPLKNKAPVPKSHFYKIETGKGKKFNENKQTLKICTWNIFYGKYKNEIIKEIKTNKELKDVDVFLFQEVPRKKTNLAKEIAKNLGYYYSYGVMSVKINQKTGKRIDDLGNAIVSKYPIIASKILRLKNVKARWDFDPYDNQFGNRMALISKISTPLGKANFVNVHMDTHVFQKKRKQQAEDLMKQLSDMKLVIKSVIAGDFNTFQYKEKKVRKVMQHDGYKNVFDTHFKKTYSFQIPMHTDHIYVRGFNHINQKVLKNVKCSDHYPITVEIN